ncbi:MAG: Nif3-like dinuclear metal center hexameric protein [Planctomycetota bacterium]|nr:Nif3-like dinuclear metal center hexameric protein [Planctomycetota bacterium]
MTIGELIARILAEVPGAAETRETVDTLKCGEASAPVRGVVTTFIATRAVLAQARALGANLVITHEPTFYNHRDEVKDLAGDAVFEAKRGYLEREGLAVWRFHDFWHRHKPDGIGTGFARRMGWEAHRDAARPERYRIPPTSLRALVEQLNARLGISGMRVCGDPELLCRGVAALLGAGGGDRQLAALRDPGCEVVLCGESPEWVACEYVRDAAAAGVGKALIVLGHANSEEAGMEYLAEWLRARAPGVAVTHVPCGDPFWIS